MIGPGTQVATIGPVEAKFGSFGEIRGLLVGASCEGFEPLHELIHKEITSGYLATTKRLILGLSQDLIRTADFDGTALGHLGDYLVDTLRTLLDHSAIPQ